MVASWLGTQDFAAVCAEVLLFMKRILLAVALLMQAPVLAAAASEQTSEIAAATQVREEFWGIPSIIPMLAYVVRPVGDGPFPLVVMNHGVELEKSNLNRNLIAFDRALRSTLRPEAIRQLAL